MKPSCIAIKLIFITLSRPSDLYDKLFNAAICCESNVPKLQKNE